MSAHKMTVNEKLKIITEKYMETHEALKKVLKFIPTYSTSSISKQVIDDIWEFTYQDSSTFSFPENTLRETNWTREELHIVLKEAKAVTRLDVRNVLLKVFENVGVVISIGGHHIAVSKNVKGVLTRVLLITGNGPDWM